MAPKRLAKLVELNVVSSRFKDIPSLKYFAQKYKQAYCLFERSHLDPDTGL